MCLFVQRMWCCEKLNQGIKVKEVFFFLKRGSGWENGRRKDEMGGYCRSACSLVEVVQTSCAPSQSSLCWARALVFPLRPGSWKWACRANKRRGGAHTRHANTFTCVCIYTHKLKVRVHTRTHNYTRTQCWTCSCAQHARTSRGTWGRRLRFLKFTAFYV